MKKISYTAQLTHDVSDAEKQQADKALAAFDEVIKQLKTSNDHLKIMYTPFKENPDISTEQIIKFRAAFRRYREKVLENFNNFKIASFKCITLMQMFMSDTQTIKLMKSFISSIEDIEKQVNQFSDLFTDLESKTFIQDAINQIDEIIKQSKELEEIISNRIRTYIQTNILGRTWIDDVSNKLKEKIEKKPSIMMELLNQKEKSST